MDHLNDEVSQTELEEWLQTTDVFEQEFERSRSSQGVTSSPTYRPKRSDFKRKSSFDDVRSDERVFGIDVQTALRGAAQQDGVELASSGDVHVSNINNYSASCSSSSSLKSKSQSSNSHQAVIDLTATEPAIIDLTTNTLCQPPTTCATASPTMMYDQDRNDDRLGSYKRARMSFDSSTNIEESHNMLSLADPTSSSFVANIGATGHNLLDRTKSCPTTHRSSVEFINNWQKLSHQDPRRTSLPESMEIHKCQTLSHQDPRRTSLSESMPPASSQDSSSPTSFFRSMDEQSSRFHRMMNSGSEAPHYGDATISCDSTTLSNRSNYDELQDAMSQTQQSRRMIMGALSGSTRRDSNNDIASSAHHVPATAVQLPEFGIQCGLIGMAGPPPHPHSLPASSTATRTTDSEVTAADAEAKRNLESIAREQMILEKRLAEIRSMMNEH